jgi:hypothetical protein
MKIIYMNKKNLKYSALKKKYESQIAEGLATLEIYFTNSVGIGEHPQHIEEMDKFVEQVASAQDKLQILDLYFTETGTLQNYE